METARSHGLCGTYIERRHSEDGFLHGEYYRPNRAHDSDEENSGLFLTEPENGEWHPADGWECLKSERKHTESITHNAYTCTECTERDTNSGTNKKTCTKALQRNKRRGD
jgi:hypothetical protein